MYAHIYSEVPGSRRGYELGERSEEWPTYVYGGHCLTATHGERRKRHVQEYRQPVSPGLVSPRTQAVWLEPKEALSPMY